MLLQEPEWDVSSAFVAKVANHIRLRGQMGGATVSSSREDEENEGSGSQVPHTPALHAAAELTSTSSGDE